MQIGVRLEASFAFPLLPDGLLVLFGGRVRGFDLPAEFAEAVVEALVEFRVGHDGAACLAGGADVDHDGILAPE